MPKVPPAATAMLPLLRRVMSPVPVSAEMPKAPPAAAAISPLLMRVRSPRPVAARCRSAGAGHGDIAAIIQIEIARGGQRGNAERTQGGGGDIARVTQHDPARAGHDINAERRGSGRGDRAEVLNVDIAEEGARPNAGSPGGDRAEIRDCDGREEIGGVGEDTGPAGRERPAVEKADEAAGDIGLQVDDIARGAAVRRINAGDFDARRRAHGNRAARHAAGETIDRKRRGRRKQIRQETGEAARSPDQDSAMPSASKFDAARAATKRPPIGAPLSNRPTRHSKLAERRTLAKERRAASANGLQWIS